MSLIKCRECQKEISSEAPTCPGCGNPQKPIRQQPRSVFATTFKVVISLFVIFVVLPILFFIGLYRLGDFQMSLLEGSKEVANYSVAPKSPRNDYNAYRQIAEDSVQREDCVQRECGAIFKEDSLKVHCVKRVKALQNSGNQGL